MSGINTTLVLYPTATELADITFDQSGVTSATSGYIMDAGALRLNEEDRLAIAYAEGSRRDGGEVASAHGPLVDLSFTAIVSDTTRAGMIDKANDLMAAVTDPDGGLLKFKPDGVGAGVLDTYYHYLQSPPPALAQIKGNRWDAPPNDNGVYRVVLEVVLKTLPFATSNPSSPVSVLGATTVYNIGNGSADFATIDADDVKGTLPALVRLQATPGVSGASSIGRLWIAKRSKTLTSFEGTYLSSSSSAISPTGVWSTQTDASRCGGNYVRCTATQNGQVYGRRFTIANWDSHKGRAALAAVVRSNGTGVAEWDVYYGWTIGNTPLSGEHQQVSKVQAWQVVMLGELDIPETELSTLDALDLYIDVYVVRQSGSGTFDIDAIKLFYTDEAALQVDMPAGYGASSTYKFLLENLTGEEIAHVLNASTNKLAYLPGVLGNFITAEPNRDTRLEFAWQRYELSEIDESFGGYTKFYKQIADFGSAEGWVGGTPVTDQYYYAQGDQGLEITLDGGAGEAYASVACNLAAFAAGAYVCMFSRLAFSVAPSAVSITIKLETSTSGYYDYTASLTPDSAVAQQIAVAKSDFTAHSDPFWGDISRVVLTASVTGGTAVHLYVDDLRAGEIDPDDSDLWNETGGEWVQAAHAPGMHVYEDMTGHPYSAGGAGYWQCQFYADTVDTDFAVSMCVEKRSSDRTAAILFRWEATDFNTQDGYLFEHHTNIARCYRYDNGSETLLDAISRYDLVDTPYWMGVVCKGSAIKCFVSRTEADLFDASNMVISVSSATYSGGYLGIAGHAQVRMTDVRLKSLKELHVPADSISVQAHAIFRTIFPFCE